MATECELIITGATCAHLDQQHANQWDHPDIRVQKVERLNELQVGDKGVCTGGETNTCPLGHVCKDVTITSVFVGALSRVEYIPVKPEAAENASTAMRDACTRPPGWYLSARAAFERNGVTEWAGVQVKDMSWQ